MSESAGRPGPSAEELYDLAPCGYLSTTPDGTVVRVNQTLLRWTGRTREQVEGRPMTDLLTAGGLLFYETHYLSLLHVQGHVDGMALDVVTADGGSLPVLVSAAQSRDADDRPGLVHVTLTSARSRAAYEQELRRSRQAAEQSEARMRLLHEVREACRSALDRHAVVTALQQCLARATRGGAVAAWLADEEGRLVLETGDISDLSPAELTLDQALPAAECVRRRTPLAVRADDVARDWPAVAAPLAAARREALVVVPLVAEDAVLGVVQVLLRRDRPVPPEELEVLAAAGRDAGQALLRCELPEHLQGLPLHDAVTGAATPALFGERLGAAVTRAAGLGHPVAVLLLDVSVAGEARDELAPVLHSRVVAELGQRLRGALRAEDSAARVGRQRFAVLAEGCPVSQAAGYAEALQDALSSRPAVGVPVAVTVGCAVFDPTVDGRSVTVSALLDWAATALSEASARGPGRRVVQGPATRQAARALGDAERTVRKALDDDDVLLHYQPVVDLRSGEVVGVEALCRVRLPDGSVLAPAHFIDAAEDSGLVLPLGQRALSMACAMQQQWAAAGTDLDVAVNVAAAQARQPGFADAVLEVLATTGCPPQRLVLELTESALLTATAATLQSFDRVRAAGVRVALDDFGTRYASLDYVRSFPLDELKVDQSFVAGLPSSKVARAIVRLVAQLADELDLVCVAEGIETPAQIAFLRELGVLGQGFAVGRPVPADELLGLVRQSRTALVPVPRGGPGGGGRV